MTASVAILTRQPEDNAALRARLEADGVRVIELPCVRVEPLEDLSALAAEIGRLDADDWLVVTSRAGADAVARVALAHPRVAAVGETTATRLRERGIAVAFIPSAPHGEQLARELPAAHIALLARSDRALEDLPLILRARGFIVREAVAYRTVAQAEGDVAAVRAALADSGLARVQVASPSAVGAFVNAVGADLCSDVEFVASGRATADAVRARVPAARLRTEEEMSHVAHC